MTEDSQAADLAIHQLLAAAEALPAAIYRRCYGLVPIVLPGFEQESPEGWCWKNLCELALLESGHTPSRRHPEWWGGDVPWLALPDIRHLDGEVATETSEMTNEAGLANSSARLLPADTVALSRTASVGFVTIFGRPMATSQDFVNWICGDDLRPRFLMHSFRASYRYLRSIASGATHKTIYMPAVKSLRICVPNLERQDVLVTMLDTSLQVTGTLAEPVHNGRARGRGAGRSNTSNQRQRHPRSSDSGTRIKSQGALDAVVWDVCDVLRRSNCAGALQYVPELTWILFLRILDEREEAEAQEAAAVGEDFAPSLESPFRWRDWAATPPKGEGAQRSLLDRKQGWKRAELTETRSGAFFGFVNDELLPHLRGLRDRPNATVRQKIVGEIMAGVDRTRVDTERNLLDVLDRVHGITAEATDPTHYFTLSQVYEGLLLKMGEKGNDGGQFFTPREVIRGLVRMVDPKPGETVYDPCCGTGGFLAQAFEHVRGGLGTAATATDLRTLKQDVFFGREKENLIFPIALANLVLHGIDRPNLWHGNTLTGGEIYGGLFESAPPAYDVILTNPPFGGKEGDEAQARFAYKTKATTVLFLQHVIDSLAPGGRCGMVVDEGVLFRTNEKAFVQVKRKLLDDCDLQAVVSMPPGTFVNAGAGVKTNLLLFARGGPTERIWYYDLSDVKVTKRKPFTADRFDDVLAKLPDREDSDRSWTVSRKEIAARGYDLKAVNPNAVLEEDTRTPGDLLDEIDARGREIAAAAAELRGLLDDEA